MPSILDRLLGRKPAAETKAAEDKVAEDVARARREELARKQQEADAARKRFEEAEAEKARLAALAAEKTAAEARAKATAAGAAVASGSSWAQGAPAQAQAATTLAAGERSYVVVSGDSLSKIAKELYGDAKRWPEIYEANKQLIGDNPNMIQPGQTLRIP
jgi:nucleoid-associated protein YgaU